MRLQLAFWDLIITKFEGEMNMPVETKEVNTRVLEAYEGFVKHLGKAGK